MKTKKIVGFDVVCCKGYFGEKCYYTIRNRPVCGTFGSCEQGGVVTATSAELQNLKFGTFVYSQKNISKTLDNIKNN